MLAVHHGNSVANSVVCTTAVNGCFQAKLTLNELNLYKNIARTFLAQ